ncbi:hypothetical protein [Streptomyces sp. AM 2-1-1]|uniref:hypothetical protein n=1 Tax=Streptomyces sp. AM 2-1-1 TaxID=3028709 RepID=UPI0023B93D41|nr:hypothetical protein [Streptomyces sp. AM 2-1-1]WEH44014.1 hypothetical protein PZB77_31130 [Streptomyces sp. AM 2-1-1]
MNEAELRHWKSLVMVELLLEFASSGINEGDSTKAYGRMEALSAVTYEDYQQAKKALAEKKAAG